jgi:orotidine-5'-phosphate decarboxylase
MIGVSASAEIEAQSSMQSDLLSQKDIPSRERLIFALDVPSGEEARRFIEVLGDTVHFYKLGLELFMAGGYFQLVDELIQKGKQVFVDLKFFDVPQTVGSAVRQLSKRQVSFASVHGNQNILEAACAAKNGVKVLAVTVLTSLDESDLKDLGFQCSPKELVLSRARRALEIGCDGVISSGLEAADLRREFGQHFVIVTPGIRPVANVDDQKRTVDVEEAFLSGADYIVVGRPIKTAADPRQAAERIQDRIAKLFPPKS